MRRESNRFIVNASWLIKLRWVAVIGQMLTIGGVILVFGIKIEMLWGLWAVIGLTAVSNLVLSGWFYRWSNADVPKPLPWDLILGLIMVMDMISLTALLFASGGPNNPFLMFFFVNISLCAVVLNRHWAWSLNLMCILCFGFLLYNHHEIEQLDLGIWMLPIRQTGWVSLPQLGMLAAFATCASVIVYFMTRLTDELRQQQIDLARIEKLQARSEKMQALGTLAAGAAHELATPLSTIAIVAKDVENAFENQAPAFEGADEFIEDVRLIRSQLDRCRKILDRMSSHAGDSAGREFDTTTLKHLADEILEELPEKAKSDCSLPKQCRKKKRNCLSMNGVRRFVD